MADPWQCHESPYYSHPMPVPVMEYHVIYSVIALPREFMGFHGRSTSSTTFMALQKHCPWMGFHVSSTAMDGSDMKKIMTRE